jgi:hypothetical protein
MHGMRCVTRLSNDGQNLTSVGPSRKHRRTKSEQETFPLVGTVSKGSEDVDTTTFRFQSRRNIDVRITPLILAAAAQLEEDIATNVSTSIYRLELVADFGCSP